MDKWALAAVVVMAMGCGATRVAGDACTKEGSWECSTETELLVCNDGVMLAVACRGGCSEDKPWSPCDFTGALEGDVCHRGGEAVTACDPTNPDRGLICQAGSFRAYTCKSCVRSRNQNLCRD